MKIRKIERDGVCRGCKDPIHRGEDILYKYSSANKGMVIIFCIPCTRNIKMMVEEYDSQMDLLGDW